MTCSTITDNCTNNNYNCLPITNRCPAKYYCTDIMGTSALELDPDFYQFSASESRSEIQSHSNMNFSLYINSSVPIKTKI